MIIKRVHTAFVVESESTPGQRYVVFADDSVLACTCPGYTYRSRCKHVKAVEGQLNDDPVPRAPLDDAARAELQRDVELMWGKG